MSDAPRAAWAAPGASPSGRDRESAPPRPPVPRRAYVSMRLEEIAVEIARMVSERKQLLAELAYRYEQDGPRQQPMEERRAYLAERLAIVRMEQAALEAELAPAAPVRALTPRRLFLVYSASR